MEPTRNQTLRNSNVTNQQALVKLLTNRVEKPKRVEIPGGATMMDEIDEKRLTQAIYNWLRHTRHFEQVEISFCADPSAREVTTTKVMTFPQGPNGEPIWVTHDGRKRHLATLLCNVILRQPTVCITAKRDGIYLTLDAKNSFSPESEDWLPYIEFIPTPGSKGEYAQY